MSTYKITIPIKPKAKASIRLGNGRSYNPSAKGMAKLTNFVKRALKGVEGNLLSGPLLMILHFRFPLQKFIKGDQREEQHERPHWIRPDADNLEKFTSDALNKVLWADDCNIAWTLRSKSWTREKEGSITIYLRELSTGKPDYNLLVSDICTHIKLTEEE